VTEGKRMDRSERIRHAATQYVFNRWRPQLLRGRRNILILGVVAFNLIGIAVSHLNRPDAETWQSALEVAVAACWLGWLWMTIRQVGEGRYGSADAQGLRTEDAGAGSDALTSRRKWWFWPSVFLVTSALIVGVMWLMAQPSEHFQSLADSMLFALALAIFVGAAWILRMWLRGDWHRFARAQCLRVQQEAGVVVEEPTLPKPRWWYAPFELLVVPLGIITSMLFLFRSPARLQPLVLAAGFVLIPLVARYARNERVGFHFATWLLPARALYCCYAVAVAAGLPQPFMHAAGPWQASTWVMRLYAPLLLFAVVQIVACELYSRRQFRRLQSLLMEQPVESGRDAPD